VLEYQTGSLALRGGRKDLVMKTQRRFRPEFKRRLLKNYSVVLVPPPRLFADMRSLTGSFTIGNNNTPKEALRTLPIRPLLWKNGFGSWNS